MTEATAQPLKVAIVGTAPMSRMLAPYGDPSWDIWACSAGNMGVLPRVNLWFEMHAVSVMMAPEHRAMAEPFYRWLKAQSEAGAFNVVMLEFNQFVPKAMPYPRDEMIQLFGRNWFTSTVAYMMAVAIARGASEIGLFGVDMAATQEHYEAQRAGCTRFIEIAEERGIKVHVPFESSLKTAVPLYGYGEASPFGRRVSVMRQQAEAIHAEKSRQLQTLQLEQQYFAGAIEAYRYMERTWTDGTELEMNLGNLPELVAQAKAAGAAPEHLDELLDQAHAEATGREQVTVTQTSTGVTIEPISLNTSTAFDQLLQPPRANGAMELPPAIPLEI